MCKCDDLCHWHNFNCTVLQPWQTPKYQSSGYTLPSNAGGAGSIPSQWPKIPHALWPRDQNIKQKQYCHKINKDLKKNRETRTEIEGGRQIQSSLKSYSNQPDPGWLLGTRQFKITDAARCVFLLASASLWHPWWMVMQPLLEQAVHYPSR